MIQTNKVGANANVIVDDRYPYRWLDAQGDVQKCIIDNVYDVGRWTITASGTSPVTASVVPGAVALITSGGAEYDGDNMQVVGTQFKLVANKPVYFGAKITINDATQSDLLVGLAGIDTTLTNASVSHAVAVGASAVAFVKLDGATQVMAKTIATATETNTANVSTMDTDAHTYEFYWDGSALHAFIDAVRVSTFTSAPAEVMTPSVAFRTGMAAAKTCTIHWIRAISIL